MTHSSPTRRAADRIGNALAMGLRPGRPHRESEHQMMKNTTISLLTALLSLGLSGCDMHASNATPKAETGYVTGTAHDTQGKPIESAKILLENRVFYASHVDGPTKAAGTYRTNESHGTWKEKISVKRR